MQSDSYLKRQTRAVPVIFPGRIAQSRDCVIANNNSHWTLVNHHHHNNNSSDNNNWLRIVSVWYERWARMLLRNFPHAKCQLQAYAVILLVAALVRLRVFARPPPVPFKCLPRRPTLWLQFRPHDFLVHHFHNSRNNSRIAATETTSGGTETHRTSRVTLPDAVVVDESTTREDLPDSFASLPWSSLWPSRMKVLAQN